MMLYFFGFAVNAGASGLNAGVYADGGDAFHLGLAVVNALFAIQLIVWGARWA